MLAFSTCHLKIQIVQLSFTETVIYWNQNRTELSQVYFDLIDLTESRSSYHVQLHHLLFLLYLCEHHEGEKPLQHHVQSL